MDTSSSVNIIFKETFDRMQVEIAELQHSATALFGFNGHQVQPMGQVFHSLSLGKKSRMQTKVTTFSIVNAPSAYNVILERPVVNAFQAVVSTCHQKIKFLVGDQVGE